MGSWVDFKQSEVRCSEQNSTEMLNNPSVSAEVGPPKDLLTSDVTDTSFVASWTAAPGQVKTYRVRWKSLFSEETGETAVPGDVTSAVLQGLSPETLYQVSVVAAYDHKDSEPLTGQETTDGKTPADTQRSLYTPPTSSTFLTAALLSDTR